MGSFGGSPSLSGGGSGGYGLAGGSWTAFAPTSNFTNCTMTGYYRRVGDTLEFQAYGALTGAPGAATFEVDPLTPLGLTVDATKIVGGGGTYGYGMAWGRLYDTSAASVRFVDAAIVNASGKVRLTTTPSGANAFVDQATPWAWANGDSIFVHAFIPVSGWAALNTASGASLWELVSVQLGGTATDLSYAVPANTLTDNNSALLVEAWGVCGGNAENAQITFGGATIVAVSTAEANYAWWARALIYRTGASAEECVGTINVGSGGGGVAGANAGTVNRSTQAVALTGAATVAAGYSTAANAGRRTYGLAIYKLKAA